MWAGPGPSELNEENPFAFLLSSASHQGSLTPSHEVRSFVFFLSLYAPHHVCVIECVLNFLKKKKFYILLIWIFACMQYPQRPERASDP